MTDHSHASHAAPESDAPTTAADPGQGKGGSDAARPVPTIPWSHGGREYTLTPQGRGNLAAKAAYILSRRPTLAQLIEQIPAGIPDDRRERLERLALEAASRPRIVTLAELAAFEYSVEGGGWMLWQALKDHHPEIDSVEAALALGGIAFPTVESPGSVAGGGGPFDCGTAAARPQSPPAEAGDSAGDAIPR